MRLTFLYNQARKRRCLVSDQQCNKFSDATSKERLYSSNTDRGPRNSIVFTAPKSPDGIRRQDWDRTDEFKNGIFQSSVPKNTHLFLSEQSSIEAGTTPDPLAHPVPTPTHCSHIELATPGRLYTLVAHVQQFIGDLIEWCFIEVRMAICERSVNILKRKLTKRKLMCIF